MFSTPNPVALSTRSRIRSSTSSSLSPVMKRLKAAAELSEGEVHKRRVVRAPLAPVKEISQSGTEVEKLSKLIHHQPVVQGDSFQALAKMIGANEKKIRPKLIKRSHQMMKGGTIKNPNFYEKTVNQINQTSEKQEQNSDFMKERKRTISFVNVGIQTSPQTNMKEQARIDYLTVFNEERACHQRTLKRSLELENENEKLRQKILRFELKQEREKGTKEKREKEEISKLKAELKGAKESIRVLINNENEKENDKDEWNQQWVETFQSFVSEFELIQSKS
jgi:hypothetical protein